MQSGKRLTLDNMVLANQNSKLTGPDQGFLNLVPRACDTREGTRGSGIIRFREESDWPLKWNA